MIELMKRTFAFMLAVMCVCTFSAGLTAGATEDAPEQTEQTTLTWPVPGHYSVTQHYINTPGRMHNGIDILDKNISGATIVAATGGTVEKVYTCTLHHDTSVGVQCYGYGTCVMMVGDDGRGYVYAHMLGGSIPSYVAEGKRVEAGTEIGRVGSTGYSYADHLHFVIADENDYLEKTVDPMSFTYRDTPDNATTLTAAGVKYPTYLHSESSFELFGTVFSPNVLISAEVCVVNEAGDTIFSAGVSAEENKKVFDLSPYAKDIDFSALPDGEYNYTVRALDEKGYTVELSNDFSIGPAKTGITTVDVLTGTHDCDCEAVDAAYGWDEGVITLEPTCSEAGLKTYTCKECSKERSEELPMVEHDFQNYKTVDLESTEYSVGYESRHCNNCEATTDVTEIPVKDVEDKVLLPIIVCGVSAALALMFIVIFVIARKKNKE